MLIHNSYYLLPENFVLLLTNGVNRRNRRNINLIQDFKFAVI